MSRQHDETAARGLGVISSTSPRAKGFLFATDAQNQEYFIHCSVCRPQALFDELAIGDTISFSVADAPKGLRGHDVRRMTESEEDAYRLQQQEHTEHRGNTAAQGQRQTFGTDADETRPRTRRR